MVTKRSRANLKRGGNNGGGRPRNDSDYRAGQRIAQALLRRPKYRATLAEKVDNLTIHPSVLIALHYYAYGRPRETVEVQQVVPVRIEHVYTTAKKDDEPGSDD